MRRFRCCRALSRWPTPLTLSPPTAPISRRTTGGCAAIIRSLSGKRLDPAAVAALTTIYKRGGIRVQRTSAPAPAVSGPPQSTHAAQRGSRDGRRGGKYGAGLILGALAHRLDRYN